MNNREMGAYGEQLAQELLTKKGYEILETNKHFSKFCEIDIIAKNKNTLVFVEVKTRRNNAFGTPLEAITKNKYDNIKKGIYFYKTENNLKIERCRIDAVSIVLEPEICIKHLENI